MVFLCKSVCDCECVEVRTWIRYWQITKEVPGKTKDPWMDHVIGHVTSLLDDGQFSPLSSNIQSWTGSSANRTARITWSQVIGGGAWRHRDRVRVKRRQNPSRVPESSPGKKEDEDGSSSSPPPPPPLDRWVYLSVLTPQGVHLSSDSWFLCWSCWGWLNSASPPFLRFFVRWFYVFIWKRTQVVWS